MKENKQNLNKDNQNNRDMIPSQREIYKALRYYLSNNREKVAKHRLRHLFLGKKSKVKDTVDKELVKLGYIHHSIVPEKPLFHPEYIVTQKGEAIYTELRGIWHKDWHLVYTIGAIFISLVALYFSLR